MGPRSMDAASSETQALAAGPPRLNAGVVCSISPVSSPKMGQQPWQAGDAEPRMVELGASASPFKEAADGAEQQPVSDTAQVEASPVNVNDSAEAATPPDQSTTLLENFLTSISKLDDFKFFSEPVREQDAPGYFNVIKHPMDLQTMSEKAKAHQYATWTAFVEDFKLMCNNAMVYNQKRSRVHKTAVTMLRAGIKQLQHMEADGCKALGCPLPAVPLASLDQPASATATATATGIAPSKFAAVLPPPDPAAGSQAPSKPPAKAPPKKATKPSPPKKARISKPAGGPPKARTGAPLVAFAEVDDGQVDLPQDDAAFYSSFSDTDHEGGPVPRTAASAVSTGQWLQWMGQTVVTQQLRPPSASPTNVTAMPAFEGKQAAAELWKTQRRGAEWRVRWLELRLQELAGREQRYQQLLSASAAAEQEPAATAAVQGPLPAAVQAEGPAAPHQHSLSDIVAPPMPAASPFERRRPAGPEASPSQQQTLDVDAVMSPPLSADVPIGVERPAEGEAPPLGTSPASQGDVQMAEPIARGGPLSGDPAAADRGTAADHSLSQQAHQPPATSAHQGQPQRSSARQRHAHVDLQLLDPAHIGSHPFFAAHGGVKRINQPLLEAEDANMDDAYLAPCTFVALDMLEARLEALQMQMHQVPGVARPAQSMGGQGMRGRGRGRGMHPQKRMRLPMPSQPVLDRQVDMITTPAVRQLSADELKVRRHAIHLPRGSHPPAKSTSQSADMVEGEGSSSEDTSDAMYATLHAAHEAEEHLKFTASANAGGGAQKQPPSKAELRGELDARADQGMHLPPAASAPPSFAPPLKVSPAAAVMSHSAELPQLEPHASASPAAPSPDEAPAGGAAADITLQPNSPRSGTTGRGAAARKAVRTISLEGSSPPAGQSSRPRGRPPGSHARGRGRAYSVSGRSGRTAGRGSGLSGRPSQGTALAVSDGNLDGEDPIANGAGEATVCAAPNGQSSKSEQ